jgi:deoxyadenosine/deoxycytidine kinase
MQKQMLIISGQPGTGKTTIGKYFASYFDIAFLDKDIICDEFTFYIMKNLFKKDNDKDSKEYKENVRDLEYLTFKKIIKSQLELETSFVAVAPFTKEINEDNSYFDELYNLAEHKGYDIYFIHLAANTEEIKRRIIRRNKPEDKYKIDNWDEYVKRFENKNLKYYIKTFLNTDLDATIENIEHYTN